MKRFGARQKEVIFLTLSGLYSRVERLLEVHSPERGEIEIAAQGRLHEITAQVVIGHSDRLSMFDDIVSKGEGAWFKTRTSYKILCVFIPRRNQQCPWRRRGRIGCGRKGEQRFRFAAARKPDRGKMVYQDWYLLP